MTESAAELKILLIKGLEKQSLSITSEQQTLLIRFVELLVKWNKVYNLTSIRYPADMISLHLLDSLVLLPWFDDSSIEYVLDVGTGGGIPGIPLAICLPKTQFVLLDARGKKIRFIQTVISQLGLNNVKAVHSRVEEYKNDQGFDRIISRAFASLADMLNLCQHLCHKNGKFLAMKGRIPSEEIAQLPEGFKIDTVHEVKVAGLNAERHLIEINVS